MNKDTKIYVAGHNGMVGSAIVRRLQQEGYTNIVSRSSKELDLRDQQQVQQFFSDEKPEYVFMSAAKVGGIVANNTYRADFLYENLMIEANVIHACHEFKVTKLLFLGSSCIYPKLAPQPLKEEYLLQGYLEPTNEPYAIAKIAGIKMCEAYRDQYEDNFISAMPTNLYGPNDNYDLQNSHVLPALLRKFHSAVVENKPSVEIWGTGSPLREFMHVDDLADACLYLMLNYDGKLFVNAGTGVDVSIRELAEIVKRVTGFQGELLFDTSKPDGTPRKLMDVSRLNDMGWKHKIDLEDGVRMVYEEVKQSDLFSISA
ncbi:MAG: GDP-L-fucose synthase [Flavobacteriales bacterium]|jgi:GDP-L-fucose synthase|nr:GDP-L-fucose synthase [Flavobacteriales bacterium]NCG30456.1 NAD-dependent epimerase/dehydratase family protein [Bacteroidota bacterium]MBT3964268.1 GDP-L-fucose synthase [Flavobacteriales bacterium]MBT4705915.1 GDP-L-fucose synthase [Flavobacteriales bacterium]MBT4929583.1 GDP-L-fucose synthase [Flavobacteriales bacterium]